MKRQIGWLFLILLIIPIPTSAQGKPEKVRVRIGYAARAVTHSLPFLANEAGLFREEGLQVEVVRTAGAVSPMALISGDTDFATMSAFLMIPVAAQNREVVMLSGVTRYASMSLVSRPEIRGAKELAGAIARRQPLSWQASASLAGIALLLVAGRLVRRRLIGRS
ncbi:MAG: ABC transporter substrate-binding protein [Deltaproteobacteria bacterium]|nr:ABC transporter substrate-binding protein [Deltaproteobacteria bacterium]